MRRAACAGVACCAALAGCGPLVIDHESAAYDGDGDVLSDGGEFAAGTDPLDADTDDDRLTDGDEGVRGSDPRDPSSTEPGAARAQPTTTGAGG